MDGSEWAVENALWERLALDEGQERAMCWTPGSERAAYEQVALTGRLGMTGSERAAGPNTLQALPQTGSPWPGARELRPALLFRSCVAFLAHFRDAALLLLAARSG